jgi:DNA uptake protein ComE-like DNA-binding protein
MKSVAFPKLGTNNGGLDWEAVKKLMEKYLSDLDIDVYICLNEKNEAEGTEKKMLDLVNKTDREHLIKEVGINAKQAKKIVDEQPIQRFWHINNFNGIGKKSYEKLFRYYYQLAKGKKRELVQMVLEM